MVEVGSMQITGSMITEGIERGLQRVKDGFKAIVRVAQGVNADFTRMNSQTKALQRTLGAMALAGAGAMIALAKGAPATAGAMAKIEVGTMKLKFAIGEALKEEFDWFADKLNWLAGWVGSHPDLFGKMTTGVLVMAGAFAAFKVGGVIIGGLTAMSGVIGGLIAVLSSPAFLAGLAALGVAAVLWAHAKGLQAQAQAFENLTPPGMRDIEYEPGQMRGTRQFESIPASENPWAIKGFYDYKEKQNNIASQTFAYDDAR